MNVECMNAVISISALDKAFLITNSANTMYRLNKRLTVQCVDSVIDYKALFTLHDFKTSG